MASSWQVYFVYYTDLDRLVVDVERILAACGDRLARAFWERHHVGGPHLRLHLQAAPEHPDAPANVASQLAARVKTHPSRPRDDYDPRKAQALSVFEASPTEDEDLTYRVNIVEARPYRRATQAFASDGAVDLLEAFYEMAGPLVARILTGERSARETMIRIFLVTCLQMKGAYPQGAVAFKSHWQGVAHEPAAAPLVTAIHRTYSQQRDGLHRQLPAVEAIYEANGVGDPVLARWMEIGDACAEHARALRQSGRPVLSEAPPSTAWFHTRDRIFAAERPSRFLQELFDDPVLVERLVRDPHAQESRLRVNLLYLFVAHLGLRPVDRFAMGYFTFRSVEEVYDVDLLDVFRAEKAALLSDAAPQ